MAQLLPVSAGPLAPGTLCEARETAAALRSDISGAQPLDVTGLSVPTRATGRISLRFSQPLAEPLTLAIWAALTEQPFPREYTATVPAGAREFVWPQGRYAVTTLRRIKSSAAPGASQVVQLDFLAWAAQPAGDGSRVLCGFYSDAAGSPAPTGFFAQTYLALLRYLSCNIKSQNTQNQKKYQHPLRWFRHNLMQLSDLWYSQN